MARLELTSRFSEPRLRLSPPSHAEACPPQGGRPRVRCTELVCVGVSLC